MATGGSWFVRGLWLALVTAQTLVYAAAPLVEARPEVASDRPAFEVAHSEACSTLHSPADCLFCQAAHQRILATPTAAPPPAPATVHRPPEERRDTPARPAPSLAQSRAPPSVA
jgi:hypothetical protein